ncbi:MAG: hypothetical protein IKP26_05420 [Clostridia bacterium]|nr:hypothetical protein [Clostridia bacterium]
MPIAKGRKNPFIPISIIALKAPRKKPKIKYIDARKNIFWILLKMRLLLDKKSVFIGEELFQTISKEVTPIE